MHPSRLVQIIELIHRRRARRSARTRSLPQRALQIGTLVLGIFGLAAATAAVAAVPFYTYVTAGLPQVQELGVLLDPQAGSLLQPTRLYDRSGEHLLLTLEPTGAERVFIDSSDNPFLANAFLAANDPGFLETSGFHWPSLNGGPQTLSEQLVAKVLLAGEPDNWRKTLRAWTLSAAIEERYGREQIVTWALNSATFGHWTFGVDSAARFYFSKPAADLTLAEAAMLAAVARVPEINPIDAPELAKQFEGLVLAAMREQGTISQIELEAALAEQISIASPILPISSAPDFSDLALQQLTAELGTERIERGGLDVITTLDQTTQEEIARLAGGNEVTILDPINGRIVAMLGDAAGSTHETTSLLEPFIYLSAFAYGYSPSSLAWDLADPNTTSLSATTSNGPVSFRQALANGYRIPTTRIISEIGANDMAIVLRAAGFAAFRSSAPEQETLLLIENGAPIKGVEAAASFGMLSDQGIRAGKISGGDLQPATLLFVSDEQGRIVLDWSHPDLESVTSPELAHLVTDVLSDASAHVEDVFPQRPAALVAATNQAGEGIWALGYSPQRVVVLWAPSEDEEAANGLWAALFEVAHRELPIQNWQVPAGLSSATVCVPSGQLVDEDCPETRRELFLIGNEPRGRDTLYLRSAVNTLNGKLATVFTPDEFIEERLFINVPVQMESLAAAVGLPMLPSEYDPLPGLDASSTIAIREPEAFMVVQGVVDIVGIIDGSALSYDVQVGEGLQPTDWVQVAYSDAPPNGELLASWDTTGLSGIWAIQLQVWDADGDLRRVYTIVTIEQKDGP